MYHSNFYELVEASIKERLETSAKIRIKVPATKGHPHNCPAGFLFFYVA